VCIAEGTGSALKGGFRAWEVAGEKFQRAKRGISRQTRARLATPKKANREAGKGRNSVPRSIRGIGRRQGKERNSAIFRQRRLRGISHAPLRVKRDERRKNETVYNGVNHLPADGTGIQ